MASVTRSRFIDAPPDIVERVITADIAALMQAANYDSVRFEGDRLELEQTLGLASLSLTLRQIDDADATLAFEQVDGHFERMVTEYDVEPSDGGTTVSARTEFTLGGIPGSVLDETLVRRQRGRELEAQLEYVERVVHQ